MSTHTRPQQQQRKALTAQGTTATRSTFDPRDLFLNRIPAAVTPVHNLRRLQQCRQPQRTRDLEPQQHHQLRVREVCAHAGGEGEPRTQCDTMRTITRNFHRDRTLYDTPILCSQRRRILPVSESKHTHTHTDSTPTCNCVKGERTRHLDAFRIRTSFMRRNSRTKRMLRTLVTLEDFANTLIMSMGTHETYAGQTHNKTGQPNSK